MDRASDLASDVISSLSRWLPGGESDAANREDDNSKDQQQIDQFVQSVTEFSSQYGSEVSVSYTARNLRGQPSNYPDYGDYPQAFVMRTYGMWWDEAPSAQSEYMPQNNPAVPSQDFVEVTFGIAVEPLSVEIYETYNPGAVVRVWARRAAGGWRLLWEGAPQLVDERPRIFSPPLAHANFATKVLRLEFDHRLLTYYTELDAIMLRGRRERSAISQPCHNNFYATRHLPRGEILSRVLASNLHESVASPDRPARHPGDGSENAARHVSNGHFHSLPDETVLYILRYLDVRSLCRCAAASRQLRRLATDAILYRALGLRAYWHCLTGAALLALAACCKYLQRLDLSWCGSHGAITPDQFVHFLKECGAELTHLRLNNCAFVDNAVLKTIPQTTPLLQELCLRNVVGQTEWTALSALTQLRRFDVYRTDILTPAAVAVVRANRHLQHVNFGACWKLDMDSVAKALGATCGELVSADFWKSHSLTPSGIRAVAACTRLQELDLGWCLEASANGAWLECLNGGELRKLFLGALRGVSDRDLRLLVPHAPHLQQLDLLGVRCITHDVCSLILTECHDLRLLDLSFCDQLSDVQVALLRKQFPHVSIKRSYQHAPPLDSAAM